MVRWIVLNRKMRTLPKFKAEELRGNINLRLIVGNLSHGDWQLMYALIVNMDGITFAEWLKELTELLEEKKGHYCRKLKGWLVDFRNLKMIPFDSSGRWLNVEGEYAVFKPVRGLQISTTFMNLEGGQALCGVLVDVILSIKRLSRTALYLP